MHEDVGRNEVVKTKGKANLGSRQVNLAFELSVLSWDSGASQTLAPSAVS